MGEPVPRSVSFTQELVDNIGYSKGCPRCEAMRRGDDLRTVHHSRECRNRVEGIMREGIGYAQTHAEVERKKDQYLARRVEEGDHKVNPEE